MARAQSEHTGTGKVLGTSNVTATLFVLFLAFFSPLTSRQQVHLAQKHSILPIGTIAQFASSNLIICEIFNGLKVNGSWELLQ
jgi:hypothetical protein